MRYLILSDIHANLEALEAVLEAQPPETYDRLLVLGDLVGYGADPNAVVDRIRALEPWLVIRGNHDKVASGIEDSEGFNQLARAAVLWTFESLTPSNRKYLAALPTGPIDVDDLVQVCHGAPFDEDAYVFDALDAVQALQATTRPVCVFGHTHQPIVFTLSSVGLDLLPPLGRDGQVLAFEPRMKYLINPGSVGQPPDGDPRAGFAVLDTSRLEITLRRIAYPVEVAQAKIAAAGLPPALANRLALGR